MVYSNAPVIDGGETTAQFLVPPKSFGPDEEVMKTGKSFVCTLEDAIHHHDALNKLVADRTQHGFHHKAKNTFLHLLYVCLLLTGVCSKVFHDAFSIYEVNNAEFSPDSSHEKCDRWVGIAEHVDHAMTFKTLTNDTPEIFYRSNISFALDLNSWNLCMDLLNQYVKSTIIKSHHNSAYYMTLLQLMGSKVMQCQFLIQMIWPSLCFPFPFPPII
jgi:hypothetical protein